MSDPRPRPPHGRTGHYARAPSLPATDPVPREVLLELHARAEYYFTAQLPGSWVPGYLAARGLADALAPGAPWTIGYAPDTWTGLRTHLRECGYTDTQIAASGLVQRTRTGTLIDRFRDRAMLPIRDPDARTIAFIGRLAPEHTGRPAPKYLNNPQTALFTKGATLFGLDTAAEHLARGALPVLVEGPLDVIAIHFADPTGRYAPVSPCGTALTHTQLSALAEHVDLTERGLLLAFDGDASGRRAAHKAHRLLSDHTERALAARLPTGTDPAVLLATRGPAGLLAALTDPLPLARLLLDAHLDHYRDQPAWERRQTTAELIARLLPRPTAARLATAEHAALDADRTTGGSPLDHTHLPLARAADLLTPTSQHLILHAAQRLDLSTTDLLNTVIDATTEQVANPPPPEDPRPPPRAVPTQRTPDAPGRPQHPPPSAPGTGPSRRR